MRHLRNFDDAATETDSLVTIGVFDGVHRGHQSLVRDLVERARAARRKAIAVTFFPHPDKVLDKTSERYYLTTPEKRAEFLLALGLDYVITLPFDESIRQLSASAFVDRLVGDLRMRELWVGADFALGFQREGDVPYLRAQGAARGFTVNAVALVSADDERDLISSSRIRECLRRGDVSMAREMLGRAYALEGTVVAGDGRGRGIGVPTANLAIWGEQLVPANGVYATWVQLGDDSYMAATNIGRRPTFSGDNITVEAHLLDFSGDIYGEKAELRFEQRLRAEQRFNGLEELVAQIDKDIAATRRLLRVVRG
ncbi:MAG: bifunctional riboflavin kinase/FAD synthetase [Chloroflexi bacterium]|nr:bifunctional riboflavin kinase/FAD synthetase [Chloroflexota bacterium]